MPARVPCEQSFIGETMSSLPHGCLSLPLKGDRTLVRVVRKVRLLAMKRLLTFPLDTLSNPLRVNLLGARKILLVGLKKSPEQVLDAVGSPDVLPGLLTLASGFGNAEEIFSEILPSLMVDLSHRRRHGVLAEPILWEYPVAEVKDGRGRRVVRFTPPAKALLADASGFAAALGDGSREKIEFPDAPEFPEEREGVQSTRGLYPIREAVPRLCLATVDSNPLSMVEAHPDKEGNDVDLGGHSIEEWLDSLGKALDLVSETVPSWFEELGAALERIVPVGYLPEAHLSASYREAPGTVYMTLHPNIVTLSEALIHETQHGKINAYSWVDAILYNAHTTWTESAVRPDLRPIWGVLLAVHAFVPVAAMHYAMAESNHPLAAGDWFARRRAQVLKGNANGIATLREKAEPTPVGKDILDALYALDAFLQEAAPPPPPGIDEDQRPPG